MNPIEDIFTITYGERHFRVEVRPTRYNPAARAHQHSVDVFIGGTDYRIGTGVVNSAHPNSTHSKALDILERNS